VTEVLAVGDLIRVREEAQGRWVLAQRPGVSGALAVVSPLDGAILALAGGYQFGEDQFNRALDARRPAGSSFKPFVYAAALHQGWTPASLVQDEPFTAEPRQGEIWQPRNFDGKALGPIRLRPALTQSRNLATIDLLDRIGLEEGIRFAGRFGFDPAHLPRGLSLALGTAAVSPLRMAAAYAVFANGGFRVEPYLIRRIEDASGALVEEADPPRACADCWFRAPDEWGNGGGATAAGRAAPRVLGPRETFQMHTMLRDVIQAGTGRRARDLGRADIAGKTGTSNEVRDSWFCGYHKDLAVVAWIGFDDFSPPSARQRPAARRPSGCGWISCARPSPVAPRRPWSPRPGWRGSPSIR
jgi:penicillin-binding protein 1A